MNVLRKLGLTLCATLLAFSLLGLAWSYAASQTVRNRETVKGWLEKSGFYDHVVDSFLNSPDSTIETGQDLNLKDPRLQSKLKEVLTPSYVRSQSDTFIDGAYNWLEGKTDTLSLEFKVDDLRSKLATAISDYAGERAQDLPKCTSIPTNYDALNADCVPRGVSSEEIAQQVKTDLLKDQDFLNEGTISSDSLVTNESEETAFTNSDAIQKAYRWSSYTLPLFTVLVLGGIAGVIFLSPSRRQGISRTSVILLTSGGILLVTYVLLDKLTDWLNRHAATGGEIAQEIVLPLVRTAGQDIGKHLLPFAVGYIVVAIAGFIAVRFAFKQRGPSITQSTKPEPPIDDSPKQTGSIAQDAPKPTKKEPPKIQL